MIMISITTMIEKVIIIEVIIRILLAIMMEKSLTVRIKNLICTLIYPRYECIVIARYNRSIDQEDIFIISVIRECRE